MKMDFIVPARPRLRDALGQVVQFAFAVWCDHCRMSRSYCRATGKPSWWVVKVMLLGSLCGLLGSWAILGALAQLASWRVL